MFGTSGRVPQYSARTYILDTDTISETDTGEFSHRTARRRRIQPSCIWQYEVKFEIDRGGRACLCRGTIACSGSRRINSAVWPLWALASCYCLLPDLGIGYCERTQKTVTKVL